MQAALGKIEAAVLASATATAAATEPTLADATQEELIRRAFAGAGATEDDFEAEKRAEAQRIVDDERKRRGPVTSDGWGGWAGPTGGDSEEAKRRAKRARRIAGKEAMSAEERVQAIVAARRDAMSKHVIVNEKHDRKLARARPSDVPYPFTSRAQWEAAMRQPLGKEWNTQTATDALTRPDIITRAGTMIAPIERKDKAHNFRRGDEREEELKAGGKKKQVNHRGQSRKN
jgi:U3 small nucleolar RNA-associated protein 14